MTISSIRTITAVAADFALEYAPSDIYLLPTERAADFALAVRTEAHLSTSSFPSSAFPGKTFVIVRDFADRGAAAIFEAHLPFPVLSRKAA